MDKLLRNEYLVIFSPLFPDNSSPFEMFLN